MPDQLVRLKPYNPNRGHKLRRFMTDGIRFDNSKGWYRVSQAMADKLSKIHQDYYDMDSPLAFDVRTQEEALELEERESMEKERRAAASQPHSTPSSAKAVGEAALTTADLAGNTDKKESKDEKPKPATRRRRRSP